MKWTLFILFTYLISISNASETATIDDYGKLFLKDSASNSKAYSHQIMGGYILDSAFEDINSFGYSFLINHKLLSYGFELNHFNSKSSLNSQLVNNTNVKTISPENAITASAHLHMIKGLANFLNKNYFRFGIDFILDFGTASTNNIGNKTIYSWGARFNINPENEKGYFFFGVKESTLNPGDRLEQIFNSIYLGYSF